MMSYANQNNFVHFHGKYQAREPRQEITLIDGVVSDVHDVGVEGNDQLEVKEPRQ